jgi:hypothetical protein
LQSLWLVLHWSFPILNPKLTINGNISFKNKALEAELSHLFISHIHFKWMYRLIMVVWPLNLMWRKSFSQCSVLKFDLFNMVTDAYNQCNWIDLDPLAIIVGLNLSCDQYKTTLFLFYDISPILTYLLTPWSRVLLEKLTGFQLVKKFPAFYGTRRFITATCPHPEPSWSSPHPHILLPEDPS